jgi:thiol:disulfide interchange protein DsbD
MCTLCTAAVRSGKAEVEWIRSYSTYEPGKPVQTAVRLVLDPGWHTYWENPGDGGMKISAAWELPAGWTAGELGHPVPVRFNTGGLAGFGYAGTVLFPVKFNPPAGFTGVAKLRGKISWLTCNDEQCVPGEAGLELVLEPGPPAGTPEAELIREALAKVPQPPEKWLQLGVSEKPDTLTLRIEAQAGKPLNVDDYEIFPATPQILDPAADIRFTRNGPAWTADVPKDEYLTKSPKELTLVLAGKSGQPPMSVKWTAD